MGRLPTTSSMGACTGVTIYDLVTGWVVHAPRRWVWCSRSNCMTVLRVVAN